MGAESGLDWRLTSTLMVLGMVCCPRIFKTKAKAKGMGRRVRAAEALEALSGAIARERRALRVTAKDRSNGLRGGVVAARARFDVADVDLFPLEGGGVVLEAGLGGLEELFVVARGEVGFVVGSAGLVAEACALYDNATEFEQ